MNDADQCAENLKLNNCGLTRHETTSVDSCCHYGRATRAPVQAKNFNNPSTGHCPPGLAKKNWHCMPPGLVKQDYYRGGFLPIRDYDYILNPFDYGLPRLRRGEGYVQIGESFIRVNRETYEIINLFDAIGRVLD